MRLDQFGEVRWIPLMNTMMRAFTSVQKKVKRPAMFIAAFAACFLLVCERFKLRPLDVLERVDKVLRECREGHHRGPGRRGIATMEAWLREEVPDYEEKTFVKSGADRAAELEREAVEWAGG